MLVYEAVCVRTTMPWKMFEAAWNEVCVARMFEELWLELLVRAGS